MSLTQDRSRQIVSAHQLYLRLSNRPCRLACYHRQLLAALREYFALAEFYAYNPDTMEKMPAIERMRQNVLADDTVHWSVKMRTILLIKYPRMLLFELEEINRNLQ